MSESSRNQDWPRKKLGPIDGDPVTTHPNLDHLTPYQRALRQALIREFRARKLKNFVEKQVQWINASRQVAEGIQNVFDDHGQPPASMPMEDIIEERRELEYQIKWFDAMLAELQARLLAVREIEEMALDVLARSPQD